MEKVDVAWVITKTYRGDSERVMWWDLELDICAMYQCTSIVKSSRRGEGRCKSTLFCIHT